MTETALDLITKALKRIGVISGIETPAADLAADALDRLNALIETWSTESLTLWTQETVIGTLTGTSPVTIGPGGDIPMESRPPWINSISWILPGGGPTTTEYPLSSLNYQEWQSERTKLLSSTQPTDFYYSADYPLGRLYLWPVVSNGTIYLYIPIPLKQPALLTTVLSFPAGYSRALRDWLAIELAPELGRPVDGGLVQSATDAKAQLQRINFRPRILSTPFDSCHGQYNWLVDE